MSDEEPNPDDELARVNDLWHDYREDIDALEEKLAEFVDRNPVFTQKFGLHDENGGDGQSRIYSYDLAEPILKDDDSKVMSEWDFAVAFGYKEAIADLTAAIDGRTSLPCEKDDE